MLDIQFWFSFFKGKKKGGGGGGVKLGTYVIVVTAFQLSRICWAVYAWISKFKCLSKLQSVIH